MLKIKYLLPLILILLLTFILVGNCDWLSGWDQRIEITIDHTKIDTGINISNKEQINTATLDEFGLLIKIDSDTIMYFFREGTSHVGDKGKIVKEVYTISTDSWGNRTTVYEDANPNYDSRNVGGGIIGSNIYLFFNRYSWDTSSYVDSGYIKSTDLTGTSWGNYIPIANGGGAYGHLIPCATSNKYLQPFYIGTGLVKFYETIDSGDNWAVGDTIYSGATKYTETCVAYIGNSKMIALMRDDDGDYVNQATSADNGENWTVPTDTNLGTSTGDKMPWIVYNSATDKVVAIYVDRNTDEVGISESDSGTIYSDSTAWGTAQSASMSAASLSGYPSMVIVDDKNYFFIFSQYATVSDYDTWGGYYGANLIWFPVTVFLTATQCEEVFVELTTDAEYLKTAVTEADGTTELYADFELFDVSEELGFFHTSRDSWVISDSVGTILYMYYDKDHADNTDFIGAAGSIPAEKVWNDEYVLRLDMADNDGGNLTDSTHYDNDGTKTSANNPLEATGKVGKGQDFSSDKITIPYAASIDLDQYASITLSAIVDYTQGDSYYIWSTSYAESNFVNLLIYGVNNKVYFKIYQHLPIPTDQYTWATDNAISSGVHYIVVTHTNGSNPVIYVDGESVAFSQISGQNDKDRWTSARDSFIGANYVDNDYTAGIMDEVQVSGTGRSAAWLKGTYNSLWDTLLTYGSEESAPVVTNVMFMFSDF